MPAKGFADFGIASQIAFTRGFVALFAELCFGCGDALRVFALALCGIFAVFVFAANFCTFALSCQALGFFGVLALIVFGAGFGGSDALIVFPVAGFAFFAVFVCAATIGQKGAPWWGIAGVAGATRATTFAVAVFGALDSGALAVFAGLFGFGAVFVGGALGLWCVITSHEGERPQEQKAEEDLSHRIRHSICVVRWPG